MVKIYSVPFSLHTFSKREAFAHARALQEEHSALTYYVYETEVDVTKQTLIEILNGGHRPKSRELIASFGPEEPPKRKRTPRAEVR